LWQKDFAKEAPIIAKHLARLADSFVVKVNDLLAIAVAESEKTLKAREVKSKSEWLGMVGGVLDQLQAVLREADLEIGKAKKEGAKQSHLTKASHAREQIRFVLEKLNQEAKETLLSGFADAARR
jgi:soluble P-type ATPase